MDLFEARFVSDCMEPARPVALALLAASLLLAQRPEFEVASIKPSGPITVGKVNIGVHIDGAQVTCTGLSLRDYIRMAYQVKDYQISGPEWIASERYDVAAKLPAGAARSQVRNMIQSLLEDRFGLKMHPEKKELPVYGLVAAKGGAKVKPSPPDPETDGADSGRAPVNVSVGAGRGGMTMDLGKGSHFSFSGNKLEAKKVTMAAFAEMLARFVDKPVVDMTELHGDYDVMLELTPEDFRAMHIRSAIVAGVQLPPQVAALADGAPGDSLYAALQQLGLKLESRKAPLDVLVVDHAERTPSDN